MSQASYITVLKEDYAAEAAERNNLRVALQMMWDTACKSPTSTPSKAAFLMTQKLLYPTRSEP